MRLPHTAILAGLILALSACQSLAPATTNPFIASDPATRPTDQIAVWEDDIAAFEAEDAINPPPQDAIVFVGSSSIVFWTTLAEDMAPLSTIRRGFGGSKIYEALHYADRIVWPYQPKAIVMFSGTNDLTIAETKHPDLVVQGYIDFVAETRKRLPDVDIHYISITPTRARDTMYDLVAEVNTRIEALTQGDDRLFFINTATATQKDGAPNAELFRNDRLHLNADGYKVWASIVRPHLMAMYGEEGR